MKLYHIISQSQKLNHKEIQVIYSDQEVQVNISFCIFISLVHVILPGHFKTMRLLGLWPSFIFIWRSRDRHFFFKAGIGVPIILILADTCLSFFLYF